MLYEYQLKIAGLYNVPIGKIMSKFFDKEKYVFHYMRLGLKLKQIHCVLEFSQKSIKSLRNRIDVILVINEKNFLKGTSKPLGGGYQKCPTLVF